MSHWQAVLLSLLLTVIVFVWDRLGERSRVKRVQRLIRRSHKDARLVGDASTVSAEVKSS